MSSDTTRPQEGPMGTEWGEADGSSWKSGDAHRFVAFAHDMETPWLSWWSVVDGQSADSWRLLATDKDVAAYRASDGLDPGEVFNLFVGPLAKQGLSATYHGEPFSWYPVPLHDGARWTGQLPVLDRRTGEGQFVDAAFTADSAQLASPWGNSSGLRISAMTNGKTVMEYSYLPETGWLSYLDTYDSDGTQVYHIELVNFTRQHVGQVYDFQAEQLVDHRMDVPNGTLRDEFDVSGDAVHMVIHWGIRMEGGAGALAWTPPDRETQYQYASGFTYTGRVFVDPARQGTWDVTTALVGALRAEAWFQAWEVTSVP